MPQLLPRCETGKVCFPKRDAQARKNYLHKRGNAILRIYHCPLCNSWHLSSIKRDQARRVKDYGGYRTKAASGKVRKRESKSRYSWMGDARW